MFSLGVKGKVTFGVEGRVAAVGVVGRFACGAVSDMFSLGVEGNVTFGVGGRLAF